MALTTKSNSEEKRSDLCRFLGKDGEIKQPELKKYKMKKQIKMLLASTVVAAAGYGIYTSQAREVNYVSDLIMENVEALASYEVDRPDCEYEVNEDCQMFVIYADGNWGLDVLKNHRKKDGWG
ncbi:NVEALA domain-containing protein [Mediterranea sp. An20]|uniref:NVEALA domain-containing protein n=1 Tax=Mediterranea sp. An20 TaxID=1965586 RepID=UPI001EF3DED2|nr:NVEALA domain-containing protein [Mediterranea sp. An20]